MKVVFFAVRFPIAKIVEVIVVRVAPGFVNLLSILLVGRHLSTAEYGAFSITLATTALVAICITGPIRFSIVPRRAAYEAQKKGHDFERGVLSLLFLSTSCLAVVGAILWSLGAVKFIWVALAVGSAAFDGWLPVLQARMQFWRYGAAAWTRAGAIVIFLYITLAQEPTASAALWAYLLGNLAGVIAGWTLSGCPLPGKLPGEMLRSTIGLGSSLTLANVSESVLSLGMRYLVLWFGTPEFLGLFTYALDVAQRSVGVVVNVVAFAVVPKAYQTSANIGRQAMQAYLIRVGTLAFTMAILVVLLVLLLNAVGWLQHWLGMSLPGVIFGGVATGVIVNRLKKLVLDPVAINFNSHVSIPMGYTIVAPIAAVCIAWLLQANHDILVSVIYAASYLGVAAITGMLLWINVKQAR